MNDESNKVDREYGLGSAMCWLVKNTNKGKGYFTFMIYLNGNFKGGATTFDDLVIFPKTGAPLIFYHSLEHEGSEVLEGTKYALRTDMMFSLK